MTVLYLIYLLNMFLKTFVKEMVQS